MFVMRLIAISLAGLVGCTTGSKQDLAEVDLALKQGPAALESLCVKGLSGACALAGKPAEAKHIVPLLQSVTSDSQARFVAVVPRDESPLYYLRRAASVSRLVSERFQHTNAKFSTDQIEALELKPGETYELLVLGSDGRLWDRRSFRALDVAGHRARVAVISCMDDHLREPMLKMWPQVMAQKPDAIWMIGDNVYADHLEKGWGETNPDILWDRYVETRQDLPVFKANPLIPVFATWDDHDFGRNDSDRTYPYKDQSAEVFFAFFAQKKPAPGFERGPGVASWWTGFGLEVALLDDRTFRSPDRLEVPDQTHFGPDQERWLEQHLESAKKPVLLVDGDQFFGGYHRFESYEGSHPTSFKRALEQWRKAKVPLLFVSGDRHLSEILNVDSESLGFPTFEITSSAIHATVFANAFKENPSPHQLIGVAGQYNYSILEFMRAERGLLQLSVQAFGLDQKLLYQKTLTVKR